MAHDNNVPKHTRHQVRVAPGVDLLVRDFGPPGAPAVIYHHGTPSSSLELPGGWQHEVRSHRLVTFDRPGYGGSHNMPGRHVADAAQWSATIADALGIDRFALMGTSGGGPHAAAAAALLGTRVTKVCVSVGLGPTWLEGFDIEAGLPSETVAEFRCARRGESALRAFIGKLMAQPDPLADWMHQLPPSDQEVLSRPEVAAEERASSGASLETSLEGWLEDDLAFFARPWGAELSTISADVLLLYGGADVLVPHTHGDAMLRAIGHGHLLKVPDGGHWMRDHEPAVLGWLVGAKGAVPDLTVTGATS